MRAVRSSENRTTELRLINLFKVEKLSGWRRKAKVFGKPDFIFPKARLAIFVDGDFWHGHPTRHRMPTTRVEYWRAKISKNRARDTLVTRMLRKRRWMVIRLWESDLKRTPEKCVRRIRRALAKSQNRGVSFRLQSESPTTTRILPI